ncbi:MAG: GTPase Era [Chloroflexota bacterium]|nr:GTPase Era [Chloroflexota bacterium]MDE2970495.1 GTPase Era [Chloroflexota bacterium]
MPTPDASGTPTPAGHGSGRARRPRRRAAKAHRMGFVTILGRPNAGKSTLLNALLKEKLAITSPRPQTTRQQLLGILTHDDYQIVFWDTPGYMRRTRDALDRRMLGHVQEAMLAADVALLVAEPRPPGETERSLLKALAAEETPTVIAVNKVDKVSKPTLLPVIQAYNELAPAAEIVPISALNADGTDLLVQLLVERLPRRGPEYAADELTDRSERFLASEMVREQLFRRFGQEVPYDTAVEVEEFAEADGVERTKDYLRVIVYVNRASQRRILIGKGGSAMKEVATAARLQMEDLFGRPLFLEVWVQVWGEWRDDPAFLEDVGY